MVLTQFFTSFRNFLHFLGKNDEENFPNFFLEETKAKYKEFLWEAQKGFLLMKISSLAIRKHLAEIEKVENSISSIEFFKKEKLNDAEMEMERRLNGRKSELENKILEEERTILSENFLGSLSAQAENDARQWEWNKIYKEGSYYNPISVKTEGVAPMGIQPGWLKERRVFKYQDKFFVAEVELKGCIPSVKFLTNNYSQMSNEEVLAIIEETHKEQE